VDTALTERTALSIVVTGASRGPGLAVVRKLARAGHTVSGITVSSTDATQVRAAGGLPVYADETRGSELASLVRMAKADVVVDLGRQDLNQTIQNAAWDGDELVARARAAAQGARDGGAKFLVATSYAFVYGDTHGHAASESTKPDTGGHPLLKAIVKAEKAALNSGVPACVLRLGYLYGPHMSQLRDASNKLRRGRPIPTGDGLANYVYEDDAAEAIRRACEAQPAGEIFNITDGNAVTSTQFLAAFAESLGMRAPGGLPGFLNALMAGRPLKDLFALSAAVDIAKAQTALGWKPQYALDAGLSDTFLTWRAEA
jgi:nucleoside-diphosphate-sugar epimerase